MLKSIFREVFPTVPTLPTSPTSPTSPTPQIGVATVQHAIIEALTALLRCLGHPIETVRVPSFALDGEGGRYQTAAEDFALVRGLDAYGDNVVTGYKASASVEASTVLSNVVETVAAVISNNFACESSVTLLNGRTITVTPDPATVRELAREVVTKLVAEGVVR